MSPNSGSGKLLGGVLSGDYTVSHAQFRWPSEHLLNGKRYPLELQVVFTKDGAADHLNTDKGLAIVGIFFEHGPSEESFDELTTLATGDLLWAGSSKMSSKWVSDFKDLMRRVFDTGDFSHYEGSLTTPPCSEVVQWINFVTPLTVAPSQVESFRKMKNKDGKCHVDTYRPVQPFNDRKIYYKKLR